MFYAIWLKQSKSKYSPPQTKPTNFLEALSHLYPLNKDGYGLTVTETKDFTSSLAENDDIELYNKYNIKKRLLENYGDKTEFCFSNRVVEKIHSQRSF